MYASRRGDIGVILLSLNVLAGLIQQNPNLSLIELCKRTSQYLSINNMDIYNPKTILFHWKRFCDQPNLYSNRTRVFSPRLGRLKRVSEGEETVILERIKQRLKENHLRYPTLLIFQRIIETELGLICLYQLSVEFAIKTICLMDLH